MSDQWAGGEAGERVPTGIIGGEAGEGLFANQAFAVDMVFRNATALLREQAAFVIVGGFLMLAVQSIPGLLNLPFNFYISYLGSSGEMDEVTAQVVSTGIQLLLTLLFFPIQQLVIAGYIVGVGRWVASDELVWISLVNSVGPAIRGLLYTILVGFINVAMISLLLVPVGLLGYGWWVAEVVPAAVFGVVTAALTLVYIIVGIYVSLGLQLGVFSAVLDDASPIDALRTSWSAASGARLTLFVTNFVFGLVLVVASLMVYCLIGLVLLPILQGMMLGGFAASWLLYARPDAAARKWPFFERNPAPYI